jgi:hypothetical protein
LRSANLCVVVVVVVIIFVNAGVFRFRNGVQVVKHAQLVGQVRLFGHSSSCVELQILALVTFFVFSFSVFILRFI